MTVNGRFRSFFNRQMTASINVHWLTASSYANRLNILMQASHEFSEKNFVPLAELVTGFADS